MDSHFEWCMKMLPKIQQCHLILLNYMKSDLTIFFLRTLKCFALRTTEMRGIIFDKSILFFSFMIHPQNAFLPRKVPLPFLDQLFQVGLMFGSQLRRR